MIRHVVMWTVQGDTPAHKAANMAQVRDAFLGLRGRIPGLLALDVGMDHSGVDYACDLVLITDFDSQASLDAYATHPEHLRVRRELGDLRSGRHQVDYAVQPQQET